MRRTLTALLPALALVLTARVLSGALPASGDTTAAGAEARRDPAATQRAAAQQALEVAERVLDGRAAPRDPSATLALRDLWASLPALSAAGRARAEGMLARPTDGPDDPFGFGYTAPSVKKCAKDVCVHWVKSTSDAPPDKSWVTRTLKEMQRVYGLTTGRYGYRKPLKDGNRGGNEKLDVYLKDVGPFGLYGYCAAETRVQRFLATGYCVLDNDFSRTQYPSAPRESLEVTAAHEFFHAVQFAYDAEDDRWLMEATATWMEERLADSANDNRQYLSYGQVMDPSQPLDSGGGGTLNQYGNWAFFEFLSEKYGRDIVRQIWNRMAADKSSPDDYSTHAVVKVLKKKGGFAKVYAEFAAGNTVPGRTYPEGDRWPSATIGASATLSKATPSITPYAVSLNHLTSHNVVLRPDSSLDKKSWMLKVSVDGPKRRTAPAAYVLVDRRQGKDEKRYVKLSRQGKATVKVDFSSRTVRKVTITVANASARFSCFRQTTWSCQGNPRDDGQTFTLEAVARK